MRLDFARSERATVGLEWEVALVDLETRDLSPRGGEVIAMLGGGKNTPIRGEYLAAMIEMVSSPHRTIPEALAELGMLHREVADAAASLGLGVLAAGSHPFARAAEQEIVADDRYRVVADRNQWWGRRMVVLGSHVHVGVDRVDLAMPVTQAITRFYPYLLALSAASPFFEGEDTGFASQRTMLFQQLATNALPYPFTTWAEYERYAAELAEVGMITEPGEIRWDVRPSVAYGTVENRVADCTPTLAELGCIAAWTQCLAEYVMRQADAGLQVAPLPRWLVQENKWRAARYGLDAEVITPEAERRRQPLRDGLAHWTDLLAPIADELGCAEQLALTARLATDGASYERQRRVAAAAGGDLTAVVDALLRETREGLG